MNAVSFFGMTIIVELVLCTHKKRSARSTSRAETTTTTTNWVQSWTNALSTVPKDSILEEQDKHYENENKNENENVDAGDDYKILRYERTNGRRNSSRVL